MVRPGGLGARRFSAPGGAEWCGLLTSGPGRGFFRGQISGAPTDLRNVGALGLTTFTEGSGCDVLTHDRLAEAAGTARALAARLVLQATARGSRCLRTQPAARAHAIQGFQA